MTKTPHQLTNTGTIMPAKSTPCPASRQQALDWVSEELIIYIVKMFIRPMLCEAFDAGYRAGSGHTEGRNPYCRSDVATDSRQPQHRKG